MRILILVSILFAVSACGGLIGEPSPREILPKVVDRINREGADIVDLPGVTVSAQIEHDDTLVLMMDNVPLGNTSYDPYTVRKTLRPQICGEENFREILKAGFKIRFEMTSNHGKKLPAIFFASC